MTDHYCKTIRIDFDLSSTMLSDLPSPVGLADAIHEGLPKEWLNGEGEFTLGDLRWGHFENGEIDREKDARIIELETERDTLRNRRDELAVEAQGLRTQNVRQAEQVVNLIEKCDNQAVIISDQIDVIGTMTDSINEKRHEIAGLEVALHLAQEGKVKSVGITEQEAEILRDQARIAIDELMSTRLEDLDGAAIATYDQIYHAIGELPIMDERDLGWGDDEDLGKLEEISGWIKMNQEALANKLDEIRTER